MKYAGFVPLSTKDYPGCSCCVIFTAGCNFKCPYCYNVDAVKGTSFVTSSVVYSKVRNQFKYLKNLTITGGEPTCWKTLGKLVRDLKKMGYIIKLDTNGSNPNKITTLVEDRLISYVAMDVKTLPADYDNWPWLCDSDLIIQSLKVLSRLSSKYYWFDYELRIPCVYPLVSHTMVSEVLESTQGHNVYLQKVSFDNVLNIDYLKANNFRAYSDDEIQDLHDTINSDNLVIR